MKNWKIIVIIISILILIYLYGNLLWLYLDNSFYPINESKSYFIIYSYLKSFSFDSFFGYDGSLLFSTRILNIILVYINQFLYLFLYLIFSYYSLYSLYKLKYNKSNIGTIAGYLFIFNPVSLYFFQQTGFIFAYLSLPLIIFSIYKYFLSKNYLYLFLSGLGFYFLLSYTRITGLYGIFLFFLGIYYFSFIKGIFQNNKKELIIFIITHILIFLPFIFAFIFPYFSGDKEYFSGLGNYASSHLSAGEGFYNWIKNEGFENAFVIKEITGNFAGTFQSTLLFQIYSILFIVGIFIYSNFLNKKVKNNLINYLSLFFLFIVFIKVGAKFLSQELFIDIAYKYFPFIANNTNWLFVLYIPIILYLLAFSLENTKRIFIRNMLIFGTLFYSFLSIYPLIDYKDNPKLQTIDIKKDLPKNYLNTFYKDGIEKNPSLFFPQAGLYFNWSPYPFEIGNNTIYQTLFTNNSRLVNQKQADLNNLVNDFKEKNNIENNSLFNLKNIFVFKDIRNVTEGQFDFFPVKDYVGESKIYYEKFKNDKNLYTKHDNENFAQFGLKDDDKYEYKIYSPTKITSSEIDRFFETKLDVYSKPIVVDNSSFQKPENIENFQIPKENQNIQVNVKESVLNPTKYYIKLSNLDTSKPFLLQLNQTFGMSWKIKWVDKSHFDEKTCIDKYKNYSITNNSICQYNSKLIELEDIRLLGKPEVNNTNHFEGNFIGNTWLVNSEDIPNEMKGQKDLYAVIIYEKQIYYSYALVISGLTFITLIVLTIIQEGREFMRRRREKIMK